MRLCDIIRRIRNIQGCRKIGLESVQGYKSKNSVKIIDLFFSDENERIRLKIPYVFLRFIDDAIDVPKHDFNTEHGDPREEFLKHIEDLVCEDNYNALEESGVLESENMLDDAVNTKDTRVLAELFKTYYPQVNEAYGGVEYFKEFMEGMKFDIKKEGGVFTKTELNDYYTRVQTMPLMIGFRSLGFNYEQLPDGVSYDDLFYAIDNIGKGLLTMKGLCGKEMIEDSVMDRIYVPKEELDSVNMSRDDYINTIIGKRAVKRNFKELVKTRMITASQHIYQGLESMQKFPNKDKLGSVKKSMAAYALISKEWAKKIQKYDFNPLDPKSDKGYKDLGMNKFEKVKLLGTIKMLGKNRWIDNKIYKNLSNWSFLENHDNYSEVEDRIYASS